MPRKTTSKIGDWILKELKNHSITMAAEGIGISPSYLSAVIKGSKIPSVEVCNKIADYFVIPRTEIYQIMGWLEEPDLTKQDREYIAQLKEMVSRDPELAELVKTYSKFKTAEERRTAIRLLKTLLEK